MPDDPTPEEIAERAAEVRSTWSESTRLARQVVKPESWEPAVWDGRVRSDSDAV